MATTATTTCPVSTRVITSALFERDDGSCSRSEAGQGQCGGQRQVVIRPPVAAGEVSPHAFQSRVQRAQRSTSSGSAVLISSSATMKSIFFSSASFSALSFSSSRGSSR